MTTTELADHQDHPASGGEDRSDPGEDRCDIHSQHEDEEDHHSGENGTEDDECGLAHFFPFFAGGFVYVPAGRLSVWRLGTRVACALLLGLAIRLPCGLTQPLNRVRL